MTPTAIQQIANKHVEAWLSTPGELASSVTLRGHVARAITEAVAENNRQWEAGNLTRFSAIKAALSFDPEQDRDLETCARRHFHGHTDALARVEKLAAEVVDLTFAATRWQEKAEASKIKLARQIDRDA